MINTVNAPDRNSTVTYTEREATNYLIGAICELTMKSTISITK